MFELFCLMCGNVWYDPQVDKCPECGCRDFIVNDDAGFTEDEPEGHFEGGFTRLPQYEEHGE